MYYITIHNHHHHHNIHTHFMRTCTILFRKLNEINLHITLTHPIHSQSFLFLAECHLILPKKSLCFWYKRRSALISIRDRVITVIMKSAIDTAYLRFIDHFISSIRAQWFSLIFFHLTGEKTRQHKIGRFIFNIPHQLVGKCGEHTKYHHDCSVRWHISIFQCITEWSVKFAIFWQ